MNFEDTQHCDDEERRYYNRKKETKKNELNHFQFRIGRILEFVGLFDST
jgi:hypothetical protein